MVPAPAQSRPLLATHPGAAGLPWEGEEMWVGLWHLLMASNSPKLLKNDDVTLNIINNCSGDIDGVLVVKI